MDRSCPPGEDVEIPTDVALAYWDDLAQKSERLARWTGCKADQCRAEGYRQRAERLRALCTG